MEKFRGSLDELKAIVSESGYLGQWSQNNGHHIFRSDDRSILNWWPSTGTLNVQGPNEPKNKLEATLSVALAGNANLEADDVPADDSKTQNHSAQASEDKNASVFVVYGHDVIACEQLELVLHRLDLEPFVLGNTGGGGMTIIEALEKEILSPTVEKRFGIVLLTPDDMGYKRGDNSDNAEPRARQNVVMEMGMLLAAFGRNRVAILKKGNLVVPSDASGIIYLPFNDHVKETVPKLCQRLNEAGFDLSSDSITKASA